MTYIRTRSGTFDYVTMRVEDIRLDDIAHSLARLCRFNGHCLGFISVAEHSVWCAQEAQRRCLDLQTQRWALMHDAAEAYVGDVPKPLKDLLPDFRAVEDQVQWLIRQRFKLGECPKAVHEIDRAALAREFTDRFEQAYWLTKWEDRFLEEARRLEIA